MDSASTIAPAETSRFGLPALVRHALNYGVVPIVGKVLAVAMLPLYTRWMLEAEFGVLFMSDLWLTLLGELVGVHLLSGMLRFYFVQESERDRRAVISSSVLLVLCLSWLLCGVALFFRADLAPVLLGRGEAGLPAERLPGVLLLALLIFPCTLSSQAGFAYLQVQKRSALHSGIKLVKMLVELGLKVWMLGVLGLGIGGWLASVLIGELVTSILLTGWVLVRVRPRFDWRVLRPVLAYTLPLVPVGLCQLGLHQLDRRLIEWLAPRDVGSTWAGIYGLGYLMGSLANAMVLNPFFTIWQPWVFDERDAARRAALVARVTTYAVLVVGAASLCLCLFGREGVDLLTSDERPLLKEAWRVVPWVAAGYVCWALYACAQLTLFAARRTLPLVSINAAALFVNVLANALLIPALGFVGAAVATLVTFAFLAAAAMLASHRVARVPFERARLAGVLGSVLVGGALALWVDARLVADGLVAPLAAAFLKGGVLLGLVAFLWLRVLDAGERAGFLRWLGRRARP